VPKKRERHRKPDRSCNRDAGERGLQHDRPSRGARQHGRDAFNDSAICHPETGCRTRLDRQCSASDRACHYGTIPDLRRGVLICPPFQGEAEPRIERRQERARGDREFRRPDVAVMTPPQM